jgi:phosphate transport system substrate-binding protein
MKAINSLFVVCLSFLLLMAGCHSKKKNGNVLDTPTSGHITIAVDESLRPLLQAEVSAFEAIYKKANIDVKYISEAEAIASLLNDSVRLAVITRQLSEEEQQALKDQRITPSDVRVAREGIALIVHKQNKDTLMQWDKLVSVLKGETKKGKAMEIVFDHPQSGIAKFLKDSVLKVNELPSHCFAANSNEAVIDYVSKKENAIGLIGASWISDRDDTVTHRFLRAIRVIGLAHNDEFYQPYQAYIAQNIYPLTRNVYIISREARAGLGSGFMSFVASDRGQRVVLKAGLVPVTMPIRIVQITSKPLTIQ